MKCAVPGCPNSSEGGSFVEDICAPCHEMFRNRIIHHRIAPRILDGLKEDLRSRGIRISKDAD
jgi:hypothetical protein